MNQSFSQEVDSSLMTITTGLNNDSTFLQKYFEMQQVFYKIYRVQSNQICTLILSYCSSQFGQICQGKFEAITKLAAEIQSIGGDMVALANSHAISVNESSNDAVSGMEKAKDVIRFSVEEEKSKVKNILSGVHQELDSVSQMSEKLLDLRCYKVCT